MKFLPLIAAALLLSACEQDANTKQAKNVPPLPSKESRGTTYKPNGTVAGCDLYHVSPLYGRDFHLAVCEKTVMTTWKESCGKACSYDASLRSDVR